MRDHWVFGVKLRLKNTCTWMWHFCICFIQLPRLLQWSFFFLLDKEKISTDHFRWSKSATLGPCCVLLWQCFVLLKRIFNMVIALWFHQRSRLVSPTSPRMAVTNVSTFHYTSAFSLQWLWCYYILLCFLNVILEPKINQYFLSQISFKNLLLCTTLYICRKF